MNIVFIRANNYDSTPAIPRAVEASKEVSSKIYVYCWHKKGIIPENETSLNSDFKIRRFIREVPPRSFMVFIQTIIFQIWCIKHLIKDSPDIIHAVGIYTIFPAVVVSFFSDVKVIYDIRDPFAWVYNVNSFFQKIFYSIDWLFMGACDAFVLPNEKFVPYLGYWGNNDKKILVFPNTTPDLYEELGTYSGFEYKSNIIQLAYLGYISSNRGREWLLQFIEGRPYVEMVVAGEIREGEMLSKLKSNSNIQYLGKLSKKDALSVMKAVDGVLILYDPAIKAHQNMFPIKFYDSMMVGTPVLISEGMKLLEDEVRSNELGFIVEYENDEQLQNVLEELENTERIKLKRERCRDYYLKNLKLDFFVDSYKEFYNDLYKQILKGK